MIDELTSNEIAELQQRLAEAEETLRAITSGEVDALVIHTKLGDRVFTLQGADTVYRIAIENIKEGVITLSPEGTILFSNHYFARMMQENLNKVIGACIFDFVTEENREGLARLLEQEDGRDDMILRSVHGNDITTYITIKNLQLDVPLMCAVITDLTERKLNQEVISALKQTDHLKDEFIGMVSHELRTPLTVLIGSISTARDERASKEDRDELLREASSSAESLASMLDNMLELSRYQAGCLKLIQKSSKLANVAERAVYRVRQKYDTHEIVVDISDGLPKVYFDAARIEQVMYNLVENAVKYSPKGSRVCVFSQPDQNGLMVGVSDSGPGITPEDILKIFKPYTRLKGSGAKGFGLGLLVCKRLIEAHGGCIWVESQPSKGCTFWFSLPGEANEFEG